MQDLQTKPPTREEFDRAVQSILQNPPPNLTREQFDQLITDNIVKARGTSIPQIQEEMRFMPSGPGNEPSVGGLLGNAAKGMGNLALSMGEAAHSAVTDPVGTVKAIPAGIFERIKQFTGDMDPGAALEQAKQGRPLAAIGNLLPVGEMYRDPTAAAADIGGVAALGKTAATAAGRGMDVMTGHGLRKLDNKLKRYSPEFKGGYDPRTGGVLDRFMPNSSTGVRITDEVPGAAVSMDGPGVIERFGGQGAEARPPAGGGPGPTPPPSPATPPSIPPEFVGVGDEAAFNATRPQPAAPDVPNGPLPIEKFTVPKNTDPLPSSDFIAEARRNRTPDNAPGDSGPGAGHRYDPAIQRLGDEFNQMDADELYGRDMYARDTLSSVLKNKRKADTNPALADKSNFFIDENETGPVAGVQASIDDQGRLRLDWAGSLERGRGEPLIRQAMEWGRGKGARQMVGDAKYGSGDYYARRFGAKLGDENPLSAARPFEVDLTPEGNVGTIPSVDLSTPGSGDILNATQEAGDLAEKATHTTAAGQLGPMLEQDLIQAAYEATGFRPTPWQTSTIGRTAGPPTRITQEPFETLRPVPGDPFTMATQDFVYGPQVESVKDAMRSGTLPSYDVLDAPQIYRTRVGGQFSDQIQDGHHRMTAGAESGQPIKAAITYADPNEAFQRQSIAQSYPFTTGRDRFHFFDSDEARAAAPPEELESASRLHRETAEMDQRYRYWMDNEKGGIASNLFSMLVREAVRPSVRDAMGGSSGILDRTRSAARFGAKAGKNLFDTGLGIHFASEDEPWQLPQRR